LLASIISRQLRLLLRHPQLLRLLLSYLQLLRLLLRHPQLLRLLLSYHHQLLRLQLHCHHDDDCDDHNGSGFYVRMRTADLTSLS
jgi:hypothetical protein